MGTRDGVELGRECEAAGRAGGEERGVAILGYSVFNSRQQDSYKMSSILEFLLKMYSLLEGGNVR